MILSRRLALLVASTIILTSCAHVAAPQRSGGNPWTIPGVLRLGEPDEPDSINPLFGNTQATDQVDALIFSYLLRYDSDGNEIPDLATRVPSLRNGGISQDGKTLIFHLRRNARWSDGAPLTAQDWLFTYHAVLNPQNNVKTRYGWDDIASASAPTPYTLIVRLKHRNASILGIFSMGGSGYPPLPAHVLAGLPNLNNVPFNATPISSGPYLLEQWNHGSSLIFVPNPKYFRGKPPLKEILWKVLPDPNTRFAQLQTHEIDVLPNVDPSAISRLHEITGITVNAKLVANWRALGFNFKNPYLRDVRVRHAITAAVNWRRINDTVYRGVNQLAVSDIYPRSWAAPDLPPFRYDPAAANALLMRAGWRLGIDGYRHRDGKTLRLQLISGTDNTTTQQAEVLLQAMLKSVGIKINIRNYPVNLLFARNGPIYSGTYAMEWSIETNGPDPDNSGSWNGRFIPPNGANTAWLNDPVVNRTSDAALHTYDHAQRRRLYQREEERLRALYAQVPVYWENRYTAMNSDLHGYIPAAFIADTWNAWQWKI